MTSFEAEFAFILLKCNASLTRVKSSGVRPAHKRSRDRCRPIRSESRRARAAPSQSGEVKGAGRIADGRLSRAAHGGFSLNLRRSRAQHRGIFHPGAPPGLPPYPSSRWCSSFSQSLQCPWSSTSSFSGIGAVSFSSAIFNQEVRGHRVSPSALKPSRRDWLAERRRLRGGAFTDRDLVGLFPPSGPKLTRRGRKICVKSWRVGRTYSAAFE